MSDADKGFEWCPIEGWVAEIVGRMHEAHAAGAQIVNLSFTHPRGYIPNQIIRRPAVQEVLKGWTYTNAKTPTPMEPPKVWMPPGWANVDLESCPLQPFVDEIAGREAEQPGNEFHIIDMTNWHPRGGIPEVIIDRLTRRSNDSWRRKTRDEIDHLLGLANKDVSFAQTQQDRMERYEDPSRLEAAARELRERAEQHRARARWLTEELG
jgi:hypothetical protein